MVRRIAAVICVITLNAAIVHAQQTAITVSVQSADVYKGPSNVTPVIGHVARGTAVPIVRNLGSWVKIAWPGAPDGFGYLHVTTGTIAPASSSRPAARPTAATQKPAPVKAAPATAPPAKPTAASAAAGSSSTAKPAPPKPASSTASAPVRATSASAPPTAAAPQPKPASSTAPPQPASQSVQPKPAAQAMPQPRPAAQVAAPRAGDTVVPASHQIGVGAVLGYTSSFGATARAWRGNHLGVQFGVSQNRLTSDASPDSVTSTQFEPAFVYGIADRITDYVWLRPYVGTGVAFRHQTSVTGAEPASDTTIGVRFFGGAEFTFASAPRFGVSADAGYRRFQASFPEFEPSSFAISIAGHWYIR